MNDFQNRVQALVNLGIAPAVALQAIENEAQSQRAHELAMGDDLYIFFCDYIVIDLSSIFVQGRWWSQGIKEAWLYLWIVYIGLLVILLRLKWSTWRYFDEHAPTTSPTSDGTNSNWGNITIFTTTFIFEQLVVLELFTITRRYYLSVFFNKLRSIAKVNYFDYT